MSISEVAPATTRRRARRPLWLRAIGWFMLAMLLLALLAFGGGYVYFRQSLPLTDGQIQLKGLLAPVEIIRDTNGVPHIYAQNEPDAHFGLGYVHAQDRLWQMEFQRRIGRATLSEILGEPTVNTDRFLRTLGVYRAAESAYAQLDPESKGKLDAYVAGVNAFLSSHSGADLPPEWTLVGATPEPWRAEDSMAWAKMMSWDLSGNWSTELLRTDLIAKVGPERAAELLPDYPVAGVTILPPNPAGSAPISELLALSDELQETLGIGAGILGGTGSNNWVVSGSKTTTGKPLLADDPHLGFKTPSIWYLAELQGGAMHTIGATIPGLPMVIIGHNGQIAWGVTNLGPDVQDLYRERLDPTGTQAEYNGVMEPLTIITETLTVKDKGELDLVVRSSRHGPLISDALNANNATVAETERSPQREALAFRWTSLEPTDTSIKAFFDITLARNWDEFTNALRPYVAPAQNFVYADVAGNIGYYAPGRIPIRASGEGLVPAEGWSDANEWTGFIPFEELPHAYNPPEGFIATANNRAVPADYPYLLSHEWAAPYRAQRITNLLTSTAKLSPQDMIRIQGDQHSLYAERILPLMLQQTQPANDRQRQALDLLRTWDYRVSGDSAAAAIFEAWAFYLTVPIVADELGAQALDSYAGRRNAIDQFMPGVLANPNNPWCDNITTAATEDCPSRLQEALEVALVDLTARMEQEDLRAWRWDTIHLAFFAHNPLDRVAALQGTFSQAIGNGGDGNTVNVAPIAGDQPFDQLHGPMYRQIIDLSDLNNSRFMNTPGQAGHPLSPHYGDLLAPWQRVEYLPMRFDRASVDANREGTLRLEPLP